MTWNSYDNFVEWLQSARLINFSRIVPPAVCTCRYGLKEYACVHAVGLMMLRGVRPIPQAIGKRRTKGRPKKPRQALSTD
ncbi:unnamed protein product [Didymodactylos carnosus]|uniref:SWIM-type domain-containing protein n=1 Tax=Didymodactylos carnosus TaxID=1234261 RepID=A0A814W5E2_9BILA|nr:unnamed protein product [Didymodactylos carnosus]CAF1199476.1 unnamed protein product [Didymodactylos carnosus]CAF3774048.1 unnamed protein product [Didymodactylos carnosus]CAF3964108.1 unnamed protein product [Didymodactylos carnosus]